MAHFCHFYGEKEAGNQTIKLMEGVCSKSKLKAQKGQNLGEMFKLRFVYMDTYRYIWKFAVTCDSMYGLARAHVKKLYLLVSLC